MADFILLLDKGEPDLGAQYIFNYIGNKIAVARAWHEIIDCAHDKNAEVNCVSAVHWSLLQAPLLPLRAHFPIQISITVHAVNKRSA
jgi:hypothetical protein